MVGFVLGVVLSMAGLAFTPQLDVPPLTMEEHKALVLQETIAWITQQLETQNDLDFIYKSAVVLQEITRADPRVVAPAYVRLLKVAWNINSSDYARRALAGLTSFANKIEITDVSLMETLVKISQTTARGWSEPARLAAEILTQIELRIKIHDLLDLVSASPSREMTNWARNVVLKRSIKITESQDLTLQLVSNLVDMLTSPQIALSDLAALILGELGEAGRPALSLIITLLATNPNRSALAIAVNKLAPVPTDQIAVIRTALERTWQTDVHASLIEALLKSGEEAEAIAVDFILGKWIRFGYDIPQEILFAIEKGLQRCNIFLAEHFFRYKKNDAYSKVFRRAALPGCVTERIRDEIADCITLLEAKAKERRIEGASILAWMGPVAAPAYSIVLDALKREGVKEVRAELCKALVEIGPSEEKHFTETMELAGHPDPEVRRAVARILGMAASSKTLEHKILDVLQRLIADSDRHVRETAIKSIESFPEEKVVPRLIELATHEMPDVRRIVASTLGNISVEIAIQRQVLSVLQSMIQDSDKFVRDTALDSLFKLLRKLQT